jgi:hypothetical protein
MEQYLKLSWPGRYLFGFRQLRLDFFNRTKRVDSTSALSGYASRQYEEFVDPVLDVSKSGRPIPEGIYTIGEPEYTEQSWGPGLGHIWIALEPLAEYQVNNRSAFGIHNDANREWSRGSAGCVVTWSDPDIERIAKWCEQTARPTHLVVDWGLGFLSRKGYNLA